MSEEATPEAPEAAPKAAASGATLDLDMFMDMKVVLSIEIGKSKLKLRDVLELSKGSVIELDKPLGDPLDVKINGKLIAHGEVISINDKYGIRLSDVASPKSLSDIADEG
jgi:flagellar motor switch protein FliN/FliY